MSRWQIIEGDCLDVLRATSDASVDAVVTDPPYGLSEHKTAEVGACLAAWLAGEPYTPKGKGFMGRGWDAWVPGPEVWREVLRVLKPGAHALVFAGSRSQDLMGMALRLAGLQVHDTLQWLNGSGYPKAASCLKPAYEPIILCRKGGAKPLNIDACRVKASDAAWVRPATRSVGGGRERAVNLVDRGDGRTPDGRDLDAALARRARYAESGPRAGGDSGRWPANVVLDEAAAAMLDEQSGELFSGSRAPGVRKGMGFNGASGDGGPAIEASAGGASRFLYTAKADSAERHAGTHGNRHPTVKPIDLMRWLVRLVTPADGLVLDPFAGSGSTGCAAMLEGRRFIGIEREAEHAEVARQRIEYWAADGHQPSLFGAA